MPVARTSDECFDHRKRWLLESRLQRTGVVWSNGRARGPMSGLECVQRIWAHLDGMSRKDGSLEGLDADDLEAIAGWPGERGALWRELVATGWIDDAGGGRFAWHDFADLNEKAIAARENGRRGGRPRVPGSVRDARGAYRDETHDETQYVTQYVTQTKPTTKQSGSGSGSGIQSGDPEVIRKNGSPCPAPTGPDDPKPRRGVAPSPDAFILAEVLADAICSHTPGFRRPPRFDGWARDIDLAIRVDGRTSAQLERAIAFAHASPAGAFWRTNVLSGATLRKQLDRLLMQADQAERNPRSNGLSGRDLERLERNLRERDL